MPSAEIDSFIHAFKANPVPANLSLAETREYLDNVLGESPLPENVEVEPTVIEHLTADWVRAPGTLDHRTILFLHGGGYVLGSSKMYREFAARLSLATQAAVLLVNYRLAPENPYPAALEDALAAYQWLLSQGVRHEHIILGGDSAGGGLALSALLSIKSERLPSPAAVICLSPWTDLSLSGAAVAPGKVDDPIVSSSDLAGMAQAYAPGRFDLPTVSPINADLSGFPPLCLMVGTRELLLDDSRRLHANARKAGVETDYFEGEGLVHCWPVLISDAPESKDALARIGRFAERVWS